ncbi:MAG TPA: DNA-directed RNA polymerase subunit L [Methanotrichaceae archaeon]|nr:DNA-directed RNA polymerase subunit L [Methanotrichaceae archaeon]HQF17045.1 DNA-directed RNA polymerase subunit L [Methanotrichaceae archaeon]HQI91665.1 DNA-directed RNA polymerase subunit L [Methanotrichaceae archaeon]HQJ29087.1 DNA-directed RNA polymerase subunit L [Methanotrichaceae archaeon]
MNLKIIKKNDDEIQIEFDGESHTLLNLLRTELLKDEHVVVATYDSKFPIMDNPIFRLRTKGADPMDVMKSATSRIVDLCDQFLEEYDAALGP